VCSSIALSSILLKFPSWWGACASHIVVYLFRPYGCTWMLTLALWLFHWKCGISRRLEQRVCSCLLVHGFGVGLNASTFLHGAHSTWTRRHWCSCRNIYGSWPTTPVCFYCAHAFYDVPAPFWIMASRCPTSMDAYILVVNKRRVGVYDPGNGSIQMSSQ